MAGAELQGWVWPQGCVGRCHSLARWVGHGEEGSWPGYHSAPVSCLYRSSGGWEDELEEGHEGKEEESANVPTTSRAPSLEGESKEAASSITVP